MAQLPSVGQTSGARAQVENGALCFHIRRSGTRFWRALDSCWVFKEITAESQTVLERHAAPLSDPCPSTLRRLETSRSAELTNETCTKVEILCVVDRLKLFRPFSVVNVGRGCSGNLYMFVGLLFV